MREDLLSAAAGSPLPAALYRVFGQRSRWLLALLLVAFGGVGDALPAGYKRLIGLTFNNNAYYQITGFKMHGDDTLRFSFQTPLEADGGAACNVLGAYDGASGVLTNYSLYIGNASGAKYLRYDGGTYSSQVVFGDRYDVVITPTGSQGMLVDSTWEEKEFTSVVDLHIGITSGLATSAKMIGDIIGPVIVDGRAKLIPCERQADSVLGYYDTYSETFYEPTGSGVVSMGYYKEVT